jgi:hypothetical protein
MTTLFVVADETLLKTLKKRQKIVKIKVKTKRMILLFFYKLTGDYSGL